MNNIKYSYKDICIVPEYSDKVHRPALSTNVKLGRHTFSSPVVSANMACTSGVSWAYASNKHNLFYILHRFNPLTYDDIKDFVVRNADQQLLSSISIGVKDKDCVLLDIINGYGISPDYITIDVAHGHHVLVKDMLRYVKKLFPKSFVIAGNIGTVRAAKDLVEWGADSIKVGLSMGKSCTTYNTTGVGTPMFSTVRDIYDEIAHTDFDVPIIADGQVREPGDVCKALVAGATMVMVGSMFARCLNSPTHKIHLNGLSHNIFYGSASATNKGHDKYVEGHNGIPLETNGKTYIELHNQFKEAIQSCMSYVGVETVRDLAQAQYIIHG